MDLKRKLEIAKTAVNSITRHDDAPEAEVIAACKELVAHVAGELIAASERRERERETQTITAADVGVISAADLTE